MNILFCSVGRRAQLLMDLKQSMGQNVRIVATDMNATAPALYCADAAYLVPAINDPGYVDRLVELCEREQIDAITTLIDPEIAVLAEHRDRFEALGVAVLAPLQSAAEVCFDKWLLFQHARDHHIPTVPTYADLVSFEAALQAGEIHLPVFVKPRRGSGSVGARKVETLEGVRTAMVADPSLIIQELMAGEDLDADVYVDTVSGQAARVFCKRKLSSVIGGANKTEAILDPALVDLVQQVVASLDLRGPNDMDFFHVDGKYLLSEINPRFGGAYLHAFGAGVDFFRLIAENVAGRENPVQVGGYEAGSVMMMFDAALIKSPADMVTEQA